MPSSQFPPSVIALNIFSLLITIFILILSIQDCGILSLCLNPLFALITAGYHIVMLALAYRRPDDAPVLPIGYTVWAYFLSLSWLGAYIAMAMILSRKQSEILVFDLDVIVPRHLRNFQKLQMFLDPLECVILGNLAVKSTIQRRVTVDPSKDQVP
ncbi:hypothetical protein BYT27DRAFT_7335562 [Phlegmacium glaucopus]|nr:hypothetical protein BYT27DRAFT_7335562 [Phlegmacium glaucopus]